MGKLTPAWVTHQRLEAVLKRKNSYRYLKVLEAREGEYGMAGADQRLFLTIREKRRRPRDNCNGVWWSSNGQGRFTRKGFAARHINHSGDTYSSSLS